MEDFMEKNLNWAVLGTGVIANEMAQALKAMGKTLYAVGNRTHEKAVTFAEKYQVAKVYDDFHEMFTDSGIRFHVIAGADFTFTGRIILSNSIKLIQQQ